ncbi:MAG: HEAT repeat domain-containing protein [Nitrospirae bacterium]|nr:HEAT repeat domain-containing protein [Nitrospirota bacterium]
MLRFYILIIVAGISFAHSAEGATSNSNVFLKTNNNLYTVKATDVSLLKLLQEITTQTGIKVYGDTSLSSEIITVDISDAAIDDLLKKILDKYNFAFVFSSKDIVNGNSNPVRLKEAWIFSNDKKGGGGAPFREIASRQETYTYQPPKEVSDRPNDTVFNQNLKLREIQNVNNQDPASIPALLNLLKDPNQSVRLAAMDTLSNFGPLIPVDQLVNIAFNHEDPQMRIAVLGMGIDIPNEAIVEHVLHDPSPQVRLEALQILGGSENIEEVARHALNDPDPSVQDAAREILRGISEENSAPPQEEEDLNITDGMDEEH